MRFGKQNKYKKIIYSKGTIFILLILIILLGESVWTRFSIEREMAARTAQTQAELEALQQRKEELRKRVEYLQGERGIEEEIRKNFDVAKEGEQVIILTGEKSSTSTDMQEMPKMQVPWYQFWR